jgi:signal transduction histidine kinase
MARRRNLIVTAKQEKVMDVRITGAARIAMVIRSAAMSSEGETVTSTPSRSFPWRYAPVMSNASGLKTLDATLVRVVLLMRGLGWVWLMVLGAVSLVTGPEDLSTGIVVVSLVVATAGMAMTMVAGRRGFLGSPVYVSADGVLTVLLALVGPVAGAGDFIAGGYPASWLFIVAYASNVRVTAVAGAVAGGLFAAMHVAMDLGATRAYGSLQFLVIALVVGWGFDALRHQERLRLAAEEERETARAELSDEKARAARLEERSRIAVRLHDSVLQTLKLIRSSADDSGEVRYLARAQERDLRRTISDYESPYERSFRAALLDVQADIEDKYRVEVGQVIKDDAEMDDTLELVVTVAGDAMALAIRNDGAQRIDLFSEVGADTTEVSIRTHPTKGAATVLSDHVRERLDEMDGALMVRRAPGDSREVVVTVRS